MELLLNLDKDFFLFLNGFHTPLWDYFFWFVSSTLVWIPLYLSVLYVIIKETGSKSIWIIIGIVLTIALCDQIASGFFKPYFQRLRPSHEAALQEYVYLLKDFKAGKFGFISSHAANSFGLTTFISLTFKRKWILVFFITWAVLNSYSRIYLGLHYPGDILVGAIVGVLSGGFVYKLCFYFVSRRAFRSKNLKALELRFAPIDAIVITGWVSFIVMFYSAWQLIKIL